MDKKILKTYFLCAAGTILMLFILFHINETAFIIEKVLHAFRPVFLGGLFAFILNRPYRRFKQLIHWLTPKINHKINHIISLILLYLLLLGLIASIVMIIIPQLITSIQLLIDNLDQYYETIRRFASDTLHFGGHNWWEELRLEQKLLEFAKNLPNLLEGAFSSIITFSSNLIGTIADCIIGLVISAYILIQKEKLAEQFKRLTITLIKKKYYDHLNRLLKICSDTYSSFLNGQLLEAGLLGILCFGGMKLFGFEYAVLISVITAISNLIPLVGPFIGAIPSAFILFLVEPSQALWFLFFLFILQQLESNLIYPKIVGNSVGLPPIWVLISVIVGGSLFGIVGMFFAIPSVSVAYQLIRSYLNKKNPPPKSLSAFERKGEKVIVLKGKK